MERVLVGMGGGVASAVSAVLLRNQGFEIEAVHFQLGFKTPGPVFPSHCQRKGALERAKEHCKRLEFPLRVVDLRDEFEAWVADNVVHEALHLRKPSPCEPCHRLLRFEALQEEAAKSKIPWIATGHHVQVLRNSMTGEVQVMRSLDSALDQSHLLMRLSPPLLEKLLTPLGGLSGAMIQKLVVELGIADAHSSLECARPCLSKAGEASEFVEARSTRNLRPNGIVLNVDGHVIGEHLGLYAYALGDPAGMMDAREAADWVVTKMDIRRHVLTIGPFEGVLANQSFATRARWLKPVNGMKSLQCQAQIQNLPGGPVACKVIHYELGRLSIEFENRIGPLIPGSPVAFYQQQELLGGAFLDHPISSKEQITIPD